MQIREGYGVDEADAMLDELEEVTERDDALAAIYQIMNHLDEDDYEDVLDSYGEGIEPLYKACFYRNNQRANPRGFVLIFLKKLIMWTFRVHVDSYNRHIGRT